MVARYVDYWRKWLLYRKHAEEKAAFIIKRLKYAEKAWAFDKLRNMKRAAMKRFEETPRADIVNKYFYVLITIELRIQDETYLCWE